MARGEIMKLWASVSPPIGKPSLLVESCNGSYLRRALLIALERYPNGLNRLGDSRIGEFLLPHSRREREAAGMVLSDDLRERVVEAVVLGGLSRNQAAARFKVSIASAVRWVKRFQTTGEISRTPSGGDRRSGRIEAHRDYLLGLIRRSPDLTLLEIQERLIANCGERFAVSVLWRFFDRHEITFMDNLPAHKGPRVEQLIKAAGAELRYLPAYSPDMNPIEKAFSKLKAFLRKIAERTVVGLLRALETCAEIFKPSECTNYFKSCGYQDDTGASCKSHRSRDFSACLWVAGISASGWGGR